MACSCNKKGKAFTPAAVKARKESKPTRWVLRTRLGQTSYASRLEAEAAMRRAGGGQIIEVY